MTSFMQRTAKHFLVKKAARQIIQEIEKAGLDNLKALADAGQSIILTYLNGCSSQEKVRIKRDVSALLQMDITVDMILDEVTRQIEELMPIMREKDSYRRSEIEKLMSFLKEN